MNMDMCLFLFPSLDREWMSHPLLFGQSQSQWMEIHVLIVIQLLIAYANIHKKINISLSNLKPIITLSLLPTSHCYQKKVVTRKELYISNHFQSPRQSHGLGFFFYVHLISFFLTSSYFLNHCL